MAKNEFLPFGTAANANVLPNADYQALPARTAGFSPGVAKSEELNTVWRQASVMASALGQFIAEKTEQDVLDNGDVSGLVDQLGIALSLFGAVPGVLDKNGYISIPVNISGVVKNLIIQWASGASNESGVLTLNLPTPFTTEILGGIVNESNPIGWSNDSVTVWGFDLPASSKTTAVARVRTIPGTGIPRPEAGIGGRIFVWGY
ncbi:hypothetical protein L085_08585 [Serratia sp. FS14]|uniref:hypothetical protein n=1 Tax=Serratia sp. (strain FS14) TaxID=1327989 RepID=UPI0004994000|nr:hypothetical protein [Serratia sp. FS14]AIA47164.1 hypothetical protein L085_08585 [Serratia sp. FS14]